MALGIKNLPSPKHISRAQVWSPLLRLAFIAVLLLCQISSLSARTAPVLEKFLAKIAPSELVAGATSYGPMNGDVPIAPLMRGRDLLGYAFITSDFVSTTGYSGKPIHVMVAISPEGKLLRTKLVKHSEPIVLIGIPNSEIEALTDTYSGLDIVHEAETGGSGHELDIISGATVTIMIIDDSIVRSAIKLSRILGLGGLSAEIGSDQPKRELKADFLQDTDWLTLSGDGSIRRMTLDVGQINSTFEQSGDERAIKRPEPGAPTDTYIDMHAALVSVPSIGRSLLGEAEYKNLANWLKDGEHAILVLGRGIYSFKGSGYVRGGIFDRVHLIQGDRSVRFRDRNHRRLGEVATADAPRFTELDIFKIPADAEFDPAEPWRLQLLVNRAVGPIDKAFITFDLGYKLPDFYLESLPAKPAPLVSIDEDEDAAARTGLWKRVWTEKTIEVGILLTMLTVLTGTFFFQRQVTRNGRTFYWYRMGFLVLTLVFIGWMQNAQLSVVNLMALGSSLAAGFSWDAFLLDPMVFILWCSVAAALLFWGRGAFCGWLCPFGALQELTNQIARFFKIPQITVPWGLHERLWPIKYIIFMALVGIAIVSVPLGEQYAEVEPFKTVIILKFARSWPFVAFAVVLLIAGLFIERFYCRYLCPLGAALAIPGRIRMFDWLSRYKECGSPCQTCANECFVQAIHPTGEINPNECLSCLHCQVLYQDDQKCPVCIKKKRSRDKIARSNAGSAAAFTQLLGDPSAKN